MNINCRNDFQDSKQYLVKMPVSEQTRAPSYTMLNAHPYLELLQTHKTVKTYF